MIEINERGPMKHIVDRYTKRQLLKEKGKLLAEKELSEQNQILLNLQEINRKQSVLAKQNNVIINYLQKLTNGPEGKVHYIKITNYNKLFGEIFLDFIQGEKNGRSKYPPSTEFTFPYTNVFMVKITNDGPADITYQTNRHARMIDLRAGESEVVSENESFSIYELRINNASTLDNANIRLILYA
jgi:hypothetical protein